MSYFPSSGVESGNEKKGKLMRIADPVLLCNALEQNDDLSADNAQGLGRTTFSIKEAVQVARNNNLMGIICSSKLLVGSVPLPLSLVF